ncbi:MAG: peptidoglycan DD-metalloendopeptidase family protein [Candidatus Neomarinimicrobiota bacterium]|nr:peptidoglycan DD-metalloendopeptidase family protein [Candidatus Neomarinimicrobiota bacterium]
MFFLLLSFPFGNDDKSSKEIQQDINIRNRELNTLRNEIKNIEERLIDKNKEATQNTEILIDLTNKISLTEKLIRSLGREEKNISNIIQNIDFQIDELEKHLIELKNKLIKRLQYLYIHGRQGALETILSSSNWNSAIYKIKYLDILSKHEQKLRKEMNETLHSLELKKTKRKNELNQKNNLLKEKKKESNKLEDDKKNRNKILNAIKIEKNKLEKNRQEKAQLVVEMEKLIKKLYSDKNAMKKREEELARIRSMQKLSTTGNFEKMKGKLPWPIQGRIISNFGIIKNQETGTVTENVGIDIKASSGSKVKSVLDGVVSTITFIRGHGNIVIIDHGGGFSTVYAHIDKINVIENEYVQIGDEFAVVASPNSGGTAKLHFEVWGNQKKLNPVKWLVAK